MAPFDERIFDAAIFDVTDVGGARARFVKAERERREARDAADIAAVTILLAQTLTEMRSGS